MYSTAQKIKKLNESSAHNKIEKETTERESESERMQLCNSMLCNFALV
jgi:hypothetical protein